MLLWASVLLSLLTSGHAFLRLEAAKIAISSTKNPDILCILCSLGGQALVLSNPWMMAGIHRHDALTYHGSSLSCLLLQSVIRQHLTQRTSEKDRKVATDKKTHTHNDRTLS